MADRVVLDDRFRDDRRLPGSGLALSPVRGSADQGASAQVPALRGPDAARPPAAGRDRSLHLCRCSALGDPAAGAGDVGRRKVPLVLCVDQLEDVFDLEEAAIKFRKAMATLCDLVSRLPSAIVVISCLENITTS